MKEFVASSRLKKDIKLAKKAQEFDTFQGYGSIVDV